MLPAMVLAGAATQPAWAEASADQQQEVEMAFDHYTAARTEDQRIAVIDYLQHLDRKLVAGALIDHIVASRNGVEATAYDKLVEALGPDGSAAVLDRLGKTDEPVAKGKLIVALRHCEGDDVIHALTGCLDDARPVPFEAHGAHPRRVCDLAYDELFLKLRGDARYGLDPSPHMKGVITEKTPVKTRDAVIATLKALIAAPPSPTPTPAPSATPEMAKPATASITQL
jgi:hypothetical protein